MGSITTFSIIVVFILSVSSIFNGIDARNTLKCKPCRNIQECEKEPTAYCLYGEFEDLCGRRQCAKGPGERCGGPSRILGECGQGMMCNDEERCQGCFATASIFQCHQ